jgi:hypothetical protein
MTGSQPGLHGETVRGFWHGSPVGPYQLLCLRSFVDRGHDVEVFTYDDPIGLPDWVTRRNARDILPTDRILHYRQGFGRGSPALHSNLLRYILLDRLGGWWIDLDVLLLCSELPQGNYFFAQAANGYVALNNSVMKIPAGHPLLADAVGYCQAVPEDAAVWGQTGPSLLTSLVSRHGLDVHVQPWQTAYPVPWQDVVALFDPRRCEEIESMCQRAIFLHMFNEIWRGAGIPSELGPPAGSYLSACFRRHEFGHRFQNLMNFDNVTRWIANRHDKIMLEEKQIALERDYQEMGSRLHALEREYQETGSRLHALEQRLEQSDASHRVLAENRIALEQRCREVESDYHLLAERFRQLEASHQAVLASTSWRLTEPLRGLGRSLRALDRGKVPDGRS